MKKIPLSFIPLFAILTIILLFVFYMPQNGDLISASGDFILGIVLSVIFVACVVVDFFRLKK